MSKYELRCIYNSRKSFYNKAYVIEEEGIIKLKSYETIVAKIENGKAIVYDTYSNTTLRHIKEFLKQNGFKAETSNQILKDFSTEEDNNKQDDSFLKSVGMVASLGNLFSNTQKESNDWKKRMLKAGLENRGLMIPEDWETLTEEEKEKRLNGVIEIATKKI